MTATPAPLAAPGTAPEATSLGRRSPVPGGTTYPVPHAAEQGGVVPRVTLQTIADKVGVSRMTVSNAFSRPDQLSADLRRTILDAAAELGYVGPDPSARALARGTTGAIGLLLTAWVGEALRDPIAASFFGAIAEELQPTGYAVALLPGEKAARDIPLDGALVYACGGDSAALDWLLRRKLPLVFVDLDPIPGHPSIVLDDHAGSRQAAEHVLALGHRRIAFFTMGGRERHGHLADGRTAGHDYVSRARVAGAVEALDAAGVVPTAYEIVDNVDPYAHEGARALLTGPDRPTAVLCFSDLMATAVLDVAAELGLRVPEDLSVVGWDDSPLAARVRPALTTLRQDLDAKGRAAARTLLAAIERSRAGAPVDAVRTELPVELVVRESTGPAPRD